VYPADEVVVGMPDWLYLLAVVPVALLLWCATRKGGS
jgi:hypothetical protein